MEVDQCDVALDDLCKRLLSFAAGHDDDDKGKIRKEINSIQRTRINENHSYNKDDGDEFGHGQGRVFTRKMAIRSTAAAAT